VTQSKYYADQLKQFSSDYLIYEVATGQGGLAAYEDHAIDCVVLEINLLDMSGFQVPASASERCPQSCSSSDRAHASDEPVHS
jgi:DNA-binding response OmpR family regulator